MQNTNNVKVTLVVAIMIAILTALGMVLIFSSIKPPKEEIAKKEEELILPEKLTVEDVLMEKRKTRQQPEIDSVKEDKIKEEKIDQVKTLPEKELLIDDFDKGSTTGVFFERFNSIGGFQGTWAKRPSYAIITKSEVNRRGDSGKGLIIDYEKKGGWCGWYTLLNGADASDFNTLSFWVKGDIGGEKFDIGLADNTMQNFQIDSIYVGSVDNFLLGGVTKEWQEIKVPLSRIASDLDLSSMGSIVLWFKYEGRGRIYIDEMKFENDIEVAKKEQLNQPKARKDPRFPRSIWVWKIDPVNDLKQRDELFGLANRAAIDTIYLYFGEVPLKDEPEYAENFAQFLEESHSRGLKIEVLTGNPEWSLAMNHHLVLNWIKNFLEFNKRQPAKARVDGVSLDVEPYLAMEWRTKQERIIQDYVELLRKCRELIDSYNQDFRFGIAITPFYIDLPNDFEKNILKYVDYAALMDYHDTAEKIIEKAMPHLELASKLNKKIIVGVETQDLIRLKQGERRFTFFEEGWEAMEEQLEKAKREFRKEKSFEGFAIHAYYSYRLLPRGRNVPIKQIDIENIYTINAKKMTLPVKIDGELGDWDLSNPFVIEKRQNAVYGRENWGGPKDLSVNFYSVWDQDALYFAFVVTDNALVQEKSGEKMWEGDHAELWIDWDLEGDLGSAVNDDDDFQFGFSPGNFKNIPQEAYVWTPQLKINYKKQIEIASKKTPQGYLIEVRLPASVLESKKWERVGVEPSQENSGVSLPFKQEPFLASGLKFGISVDVSDTDDIEIPQKTLMSSSINRAWGDPTTFGILKLEE